MLLSAAMAAALRDPSATRIWLAEFETATTPLRCWTGMRTLQWDGEDWIGVGALYGISGARQGDATIWRTIEFSLNGLPEEAAAGMDESVRGRSATLWLGILNTSGQVIRDPLLVMAAEQETLHREIAVGEGTVNLKLACFEALPRFDRATGRKWSPEAQKQRYEGDEGFYYTGKAARSGAPIDWRPPS